MSQNSLTVSSEGIKLTLSSMFLKGEAMSVLVIDGHPNPQSLSAALAAAYVDCVPGAKLLAVRDLDFDPNMNFGYSKPQPWEPDLENAWEMVQEAKHIVVVMPVWWAGMPALLKGFFDRLLMPKLAYSFKPSGLPEGKLKGRTARVIMMSDSPNFYVRALGDIAFRQIAHRTLRFCGIGPVKRTHLTRVRKSTVQQREKWFDKVRALAAVDAKKLGYAANQRSGPKTS